MIEGVVMGRRGAFWAWAVCGHTDGRACRACFVPFLEPPDTTTDELRLFVWRHGGMLVNVGLL